MRIHVVLHETGANWQRKWAQGSRLKVMEGKGEFELGRTGKVNIVIFCLPYSSHKNAQLFFVQQGVGGRKMKMMMATIHIEAKEGITV